MGKDISELAVVFLHPLIITFYLIEMLIHDYHIFPLHAFRTTSNSIIVFDSTVIHNLENSRGEIFTAFICYHNFAYHAFETFLMLQEFFFFFFLFRKLILGTQGRHAGENLGVLPYHRLGMLSVTT